AFEHPGAAGACREDPEQQVERVADGPGVGVRAEVAHPLALGAAHHLQPGVLLVEGDGQVRVRLVVAVADVEARVVLLDPGVLQLQRLDLGGHGDPVHRGGGGDHLLGARVQRPDVAEVGVQAVTQALRLADVDHPTRLVAEPVDPGRVRDGARGGAVGRRVWHVASLVRARLPGSARQAREIDSPSIVIFRSGSGRVAGPEVTDPSAAENRLPWHPHMIVPSATAASVHCMWVQVASKALNVPAVGWVMIAFWPGKIFPPPTGISAVVARAPPPPARVGAPPAGGAPASADPPSGPAPPSPPPHAATTAATPAPAAPVSSARRLVSVMCRTSLVVGSRPTVDTAARTRGFNTDPAGSTAGLRRLRRRSA